MTGFWICLPSYSILIYRYYNPFQSSVVFHIETTYLIYRANQMTGSYMKCNTGQKWVKGLHNVFSDTIKWYKSNWLTVYFLWKFFVRISRWLSEKEKFRKTIENFKQSYKNHFLNPSSVWSHTSLLYCYCMKFKRSII